MKTKVLAVSALKHPEKNVRKHPEKQVAEIVKSLEMFGQTRPVVVDEDYTILAGNGLVLAMKEAFWDKAEVLVMEGLTQTQKRKLMLVDNKMSLMGITDYEIQFEFLESIVAETGDYEIPGFEVEMLQTLISKDQTEIEKKILRSCARNRNRNRNRSQTKTGCLVLNVGVRYGFKQTCFPRKEREEAPGSTN